MLFFYVIIEVTSIGLLDGSWLRFFYLRLTQNAIDSLNLRKSVSLIEYY